MTQETNTKVKKKPSVKLAAGIAASIVVIAFIALGIAWSAQRGKYKDIFLPGTYLNNINVSEMTAAQAAEKLTFTMPEIRVVFKDSQEVIRFADIGGDYDFTESVGQELVSQPKPSLFGNSTERHLTVKPVTSYDEEEIPAAVAKLSHVINENQSDPEDAYVKKTENGFEVIPEKDGTKIDTEALVTLVEDALAGQSPVMEDVEINASPCYVQPQVLASDIIITPEMSSINEMSALVIDMGGSAVEVLDKAQIMELVEYDPDKGNVICCSRKIRLYVEQLAEKYNTFRTQRTFETHNGDMIMVGGSGDDSFGYSLAVKKTQSRIEESLLTGKPVQAAWTMAGKERSLLNDFGDTYTEISLTDRKLWHVQNGRTVLETEVTYFGEINSGVFKVLEKQSPAVLKSSEYEIELNFWMPFTYAGQGIEDSSWANSFGADTYQKEGCRGNLNIPADKAYKLYSLVETGSPVIIY